MCIWIRHKPSLETALDPRFGSAAITAPTSGAYADPAGPLTNLAHPPSPLPAASQAQSQAQSPAQPSPQPPMAIIAHPRHSPIPSPSHTISTLPSKSPHSPSQRPPSRPLSTSTQFSTYHPSTSPSPQASPKWSKTSIHGQSQVSPSIHGQSHPSPSIAPPQSRPRASSRPPSRATTPAPLPVHQAYIPADQLSIGSKLSPGLTTSAGTTPTTGGPRTGNSATSSLPVSPVSGTNGWGDADPRTGARAAQTPPWEKGTLMRMVTVDETRSAVATQGRQTVLLQKTQGPAGRARSRLSRIQLPTIKLGTGGPRRKARRGEEEERSPDSEVEQWPGSM